MDTENYTIISQEHAKLILDVKAYLENDVQSVNIQSENDYSGAAEMIRVLKDYKKQLFNAHKEEKAPHLEKGRLIDGAFNPKLDLVKEKISHIEKAGRDYREEVKKNEAERQRKLQEIADAERRKLEDAARKKEEAAAAERKKAEDARLAAQNAKDEEERKRLEVEARKAEAKSEKLECQAEEKAEIASFVTAPIIESAIPQNKRGAFNTRVYYGARITNMKKFLTAVIENDLMHLITINQGALDKTAGPGKSLIPGVENYRK